MIDILTLVVSVAVAFFTGFIAFKANQISSTAVRLEADKVLVDWSQRAVAAISHAVSLRIANEGDLPPGEFVMRRRDCRRDLYALLAEGEVILRPKGGAPHDALSALKAAADKLNGNTFRRPGEMDWDRERLPQMREILNSQTTFVKAAQKLIGTRWLHE